MTAPAFSPLDVDDDALDALPPDATDAQRDAYVLRSVGVSLDALDRSNGASVAAHASRLLRAMGAIRRGITATTEAKRIEKALVDTTYDSQIKKKEAQYKALERIVCGLAAEAEQQQVFGNARSAKVAGGAFGVAQRRALVRVLDEDAAIAWAEEVDVREAIETTRSLKHNIIAPFVLAHVAAGGDIPPGVEVIAAHDEPYARPALPQEGA